MSSSSPDQLQISVSLDVELLEQVDEFTSDRQEAITEGLRLWCEQQADLKLQNTVQVHQQRHDRDETGWLV